MTTPLPDQPDLRQLRNQAKDLLKAYRSSSPDILPTLREHVPDMANVPDDAVFKSPFALKNAQRVIAREYGFPSWRHLVAEVRGLEVASGDFPPPLQSLVRAVDRQDAEATEQILDQHPDYANRFINDIENEGESLLHRLMTTGASGGPDESDDHLAVAKQLLAHGADVNAIGWPSNNPLATPLVAAVWLGRDRLARLLLENGADPNIPTGSDNPYTAMDTAAEHGHLESVKALIEYGAEYDVVHLIQTGMNEEADTFLDQHPHLVNGGDDAGTMRRRRASAVPVIEAVSSSNRDMVASLIKRGADLDLTDEKGRTALHMSLEPWGDNSTETRELLLASGATVDAWAAAGLGDVELLRTLLDQDAALVNATQTDGMTPIFYAIAQNQEDATRLLIERGAQLDVCVRRFWAGAYPLDIALTKNYMTLVRMLLEAGADPNHWDEWNCPLYLATRFSSVEAIDLLLEHGANINTNYNEDGSIFNGGFYWAAWIGDVELTQHFIDKGVDLQHPNHQLIAHEAAETPSGGLNATIRYVGVIDVLGQSGAPMNNLNKLGQTPLDVANKNGRAEVIDTLFKYGARSSRALKLGEENDIFTAIMAKDMDAVQRIVTANPDVVLEHDSVNHDPVDVAILSTAFDIARWLAREGDELSIMATAALGSPDDLAHILDHEPDALNTLVEERSLLCWAAVAGNEANMDYLISKGADPDLGLPDAINLPVTLVYFELESPNRQQVIEKLLDAGASPTVPAWAQLLNGEMDNVRYLFDKGADIHDTNLSGSGYLHAIAYLSQSYEHDPTPAIDFVIERGIDVNLVSKDGFTALDLCINLHNAEVEKILRSRGGKTAAELEGD
ncbi:MAG: ankyrin repeat domain-containing protein [Pseudomonadota bacterium]